MLYSTRSLLRLPTFLCQVCEPSLLGVLFLQHLVLFLVNEVFGLLSVHTVLDESHGCDIESHLILLALECSPQMATDTVQHSAHRLAGNDLFVVCLEDEKEDTAG